MALCTTSPECFLLYPFSIYITWSFCGQALGLCGVVALAVVGTQAAGRYGRYADMMHTGGEGVYLIPS